MKLLFYQGTFWCARLDSSFFAAQDGGIDSPNGPIWTRFLKKSKFAIRIYTRTQTNKQTNKHTYIYIYIYYVDKDINKERERERERERDREKYLRAAFSIL